MSFDLNKDDMKKLRLQEIIICVNEWPSKYQLDFDQKVKFLARSLAFQNAANLIYRQMKTELTEIQLCCV